MTNFQLCFSEKHSFKNIVYLLHLQAACLKAVANISEKFQMFVRLIQQKLETEVWSAGRTADVNELSCIMSMLNLAIEHESDPEIEHQLRAIAGLLLLPLNA